MKILVTGAAGFIGSHLCERLLQDKNHEVVGIDNYVPSGTPKWIKENNLRQLSSYPGFTFAELDLIHAPLAHYLADVDIVFHLAAIPGVRSSWGNDFAAYIANNILATQKLLEACRRSSIQKFVYASTSSVYGDKTGSVSERAGVAPLSPYGVSKLTGEQLCRVYYKNDGVPVVVLRFFTVYGPRQRPDMAFHRFIRQMLQNEAITLYGSGHQTRDFTYIRDCVEGIASAVDAEGIIGHTLNIGGKERASVLECIGLLEQLLSVKAKLAWIGPTYGEPQHTWADIRKARRLLKYEPKTDLKYGLSREIAYIRELYGIPE